MDNPAASLLQCGIVSSRPPNILLILCDQLRRDCLGVTGHPVVETPHLDRLAQKGVVFTRAYASCPNCIAARSSLWTGLCPSRHGRIGYRDGVPWTYDHMLPQVLTDAGYQTHCVGKTHFFPQRRHGGFQSIELYAGRFPDYPYLRESCVNDYTEWLKEKSGDTCREFDHGLNGAWAAAPSTVPDEWHVNTWTATRGIEFLRRRDDTRPFFLNLSFHRPHTPFDPPQRFWDLYADQPLPPPPVGAWSAVHDREITGPWAWEGRLDPEILDRARRAYLAQIAHIDEQIGRVLHFLETTNHGPTAVVFAADHGDMLGDHHLFQKSFPYEGSAGIPLILAAPDSQEPRKSDAAVVSEDLYPTLLGLAGVPVPRRADGTSLVPILRGGTLERPFVHGEHAPWPGWQGDLGTQFLTDGREKYIWFTESGREQFFDLTRDPEERNDLAEDPQARDRVALWRKRMVAVLAERPGDRLSDGKKLLPGVRLPDVRPSLLTASNPSRRKDPQA